MHADQSHVETLGLVTGGTSLRTEHRADRDGLTQAGDALFYLVSESLRAASAIVAVGGLVGGAGRLLDEARNHPAHFLPGEDLACFQLISRLHRTENSFWLVDERHFLC